MLDYLAILLHSSAQLRQACAHCLQWSKSWCSHSLAQASQMSAHRLQNCFANWLSIDINAADVQQMVAHSLFIWAQLVIILTICWLTSALVAAPAVADSSAIWTSVRSCSLRSQVAQNSQALAHLMQASIQLCHLIF